METLEINFGCKHYKRKCKIYCDCCNEIHSCRLCHDEKYEYETNSHTLDRFNIKKVICELCNLKQDISNNCIQCGIKFGEYYCNICNLFDDDTSKGQFHCDKCGICRVGGRDNFYHCDNCNSCVSLALKDNHNCIKNAFHNQCPVCFESVFNSVKPSTVINCGHVLHVECLNEMLKTGTLSGLRCPLCNKSSIDTNIIFQHMDQEIASIPMPEDLNYNVKIYCNDCGKNSETKFHIVGHKCQECGSYNTRRDD